MKSDDTKHLSVIATTGVGLGVALLLVELYYNNYMLIEGLRLNISMLDGVLARKNEFFSGLQTNLWFRCWILGAWALLLFYPAKGEAKKFFRHTIKLLLCGALFIGLRFIYILPFAMAAQAINIVASFVLAIPIMRSYIGIARYLSTGKSASLDANEKNADGFAQNEQLITNEFSVTLKFEYSYRGETRIGYVCFINPFRGTITIGTPGSGKTYVSLEEFIRQFIERGYAMVVYDYKDPALSELAYSYLMDLLNDPEKSKKALVNLEKFYKKNRKKIRCTKAKLPRFGYISFKDTERTYRSNPMKNITTIEDAADFANVILVALNRNMAEKQGEFFTESAKNYTAATIYVLGTLFNNKYQSLPHTLSLISNNMESIFPVYALVGVFYPGLQPLINPFIEAYKNKVLEQLQGQVASASIGLAAMSNPLICYTMTESEENPEENISLDVNNPDDPIVLCIGNDPQKDIVLGLASSVYLSRLAKAINKKGIPTLFGVDELPTVYIKGMDNLIATARSNWIAVSLGFQDFTQLIRDYTQRVADAIISTCGNIISGNVKDSTAKKLSDSFGEKKVLKQSKTINHEGEVSISWSEAKEKKIPQDVIEQLSQGDFVGIMMDERDQKIKHKVFQGSFIIDPAWKEINHEIPKLRELTELEKQTMLAYAQKKVKDDITFFLNEAGQVAKKYELLLREYTMRAKVSPKDKRPDIIRQTICLERFVDNPEDPIEQILFGLWVESAYVVISSFNKLNPVNNVFDDETKFELLLGNVYSAELSKVKLVKQWKKQLGLNSHAETKVYVEAHEQELQEAMAAAMQENEAEDEDDDDE